MMSPERPQSAVATAYPHHALVESHRSYAHALAADILRTLPPQVEKDELESAAELGLVDAARSFDSSRGVQFKTYAYYRIRGAVYDSIRKSTWFSKSVYEQYKFEAAATEYMADYSSAPPPVSSQDSGREAQAITDTLATVYMLSLEGDRVDTPDTRAISSEESAIQNERNTLLHQALRLLPEKNRQVLEAYYFQDMNLEEIGATLGLSKSWTCRVHAKSLELLRDALAELGISATSLQPAR
jgi:RNA polymerase sigma factor for flagellar operon FliA